MQMLRLKIETELKGMENFVLGCLWGRTKGLVDHAHECETCRKQISPESHATLVLQLDLIDAEIDRRGEEIIRIQTNRANRQYFNALCPSQN